MFFDELSCFLTMIWLFFHVVRKVKGMLKEFVENF